MILRNITKVMVLSALSLYPLFSAYAQSAVDGAIAGTVEDATGAVVPAAYVVIQNNGTNARQTLKSDDSGFFRAVHLAPGTYTVTVTAAGFEAYKSTQVKVSVGSLTNVVPHLAPGSASETVEVSSGSPAINTTNNDFSNTIDLKVLEDLPVNNYRWSSYALLTPGVVPGGGFGLLSFRGQSTLLNNITFDGEDDNQAFFSEERGRTRVGYSTAKASILEFQVNTSNYSVEYGRSAGGVVNAVTRSGTNQFHGEAYFFDRDAEWGAKNPFTTRAVQVSSAPIAFQSQVFQPKDWRKQTGVGIGGPIFKDKLFFFFAFDKFLRNFPGISAPSSPGLFYAAPDAVVADCSKTSAAGTKTAGASVDGAVCQLAANLNGVGLAAVTSAQYTAALTTYTNGIAGLTSITGITPRTGDQDIFFPKLDWQINGKNHATVELNRLRWTSPAGIQTSSSALSYGVASFGNDYVKDTFIIGKLDSMLTNSLSNEVRYQYGRDFEYEFNQTPTPYENAVLDNPAGYTNPFQIPPHVLITNGLQFGTATFLNRPAYPDERRYQVSDTINLVRGNHNLKFGLDFLHTNDLAENLFRQYGDFTYGGSNYLPYTEYITDLNKVNGCGGIECYTSFAQGFGPLGFEFQTKDYAAFVQDEWKVNPRLSLTLGVRYEYEQMPKPQIPNTAEAALPFVNGSTTRFPDNRTNIGPRVGFAWDIFGTGKTVLRGGAGEFFGRLINSTIYNALAQTGNPAGQQAVSYTSSKASGVLFPQIIDPAHPPAAGSSAVFYFDKNFKLPEIQQADLTLEQDLGYNTTFDVTWLGAFGRRLPNFVDTNLPQANDTVSYTVGAGGPVREGTVIKIPYYRRIGTTNGRPNPNYGATTDIFSGVNSNYEAIVFQIKHRTTRNLSFNANYTWSHALDYGENNTTFTDTNDLLDPANLRGEYGNSNQDTPNRLVVYAIYNTPSHFNGVLGYLLNNYELSPSFSGQSGAPYTAGVTGNFNKVVLGSGNLATGGFAAASSSGGINGTGGAARVPTLDRNIFRLKRDLLLDLRLSKRFKVADRAEIELIGESFNIFNHLNQTGVGSTNAYGFTAGSANTPNVLTAQSTFGVFSPTTFTGKANDNFIYTPRQVQLGARVTF
jgi:hypothetical protein